MMIMHSTFQPTRTIIRGGALLLLTLLCSCQSSPFAFFNLPADEAVVYALGPRDGCRSPLGSDLKPACPALVFDSESLEITAAHEHAIRGVFDEMAKDKKRRLLIVGHTPPDYPPGHARSLSERRAQAVRQKLIELGLDPASIQTVGFGNDFAPTGPSSDVVVIYQQ